MIAEFSLLLTSGMSLMWCLMPRAQVTSGFFRIQMLIAMCLSILSVLAMGQLSSTGGTPLSAELLLASRIACGIGLLFGYLGSILWLLDRRGSGTVAMVGVAIATLVGLVASRGGIARLMTTDGAFYFLSSLSTAGVLGGAVTGMLLGHWYLTAPTMSIEPLKILCRYLAIALSLRIVISACGWGMAGQNLQSSVHWTWFALRWLAGILGPLVISIMALRILRYRNTQAATGVLFAGVILTFIGEMSAALLYSELRVPL